MAGLCSVRTQAEFASVLSVAGAGSLLTVSGTGAPFALGEGEHGEDTCPSAGSLTCRQPFTILASLFSCHNTREGSSSVLENTPRI